MELVNYFKLLGLGSALVVVAACSPQVKNSKEQTSDQSGIIGGTNVEAADVIAKSTVLLQFEEIDAKGQRSLGSCTGSLIRKDIVLTAAHCVPTAQKSRMIAIFAADPSKATIANVRAVVAPVVHPLWKETSEEDEDLQPTAEPALTAKQEAPKAAPKQDEEDQEIESTNDLAVLKLSAPAPEGYVPASLLFDETELLKEGVEVIVAGYGLNGDVEKTNDSLLKKAKTVVAGELNASELVTDQSHGQSVCSGDSGGPAFIEVKGQLKLWGVASRVGNPDNKVAYCSGLAIHSRVKPQMGFIIKAIKAIDAALKEKAQ